MILNNLGVENIDNNRLATFTPQDPMDYEVKSIDGETLTGSLKDSQYTEVTPPGEAPWSVKMGSREFSRSATVDGITSKTALISCLLVFPMGPNQAHLFVNESD